MTTYHFDRLILTRMNSLNLKLSELTALGSHQLYILHMMNLLEEKFVLINIAEDSNFFITVAVIIKFNEYEIIFINNNL